MRRRAVLEAAEQREGADAKNDAGREKSFGHRVRALGGEATMDPLAELLNAILQVQARTEHGADDKRGDQQQAETGTVRRGRVRNRILELVDGRVETEPSSWPTWPRPCAAF